MRMHGIKGWKEQKWLCRRCDYACTFYAMEKKNTVLLMYTKTVHFKEMMGLDLLGLLE